jgi:type IV pilus assembly protein PilW
MSTSPSIVVRRGQRGFSLVEIMIGLLIAMIGVVIMTQVLLNSEQRSRTTTTGNDALSNGAVMMHLLQRDLAQSGFGINSVKLLGCTLALPAPANKTITIAPVMINPPTTIIPAGDPNTDRLLVMYGSDNGQPEGNDVLGPPSGNAYTMQAPLSFQQNDFVIVATDVGCPSTRTLARITSKPTDTVTLDTVVAGATTLYNLGQTPRIIAYAVRNGSLTSCDYLSADCSSTSAANWTAVGGNVVSLRAQYGQDTNPGTADGMIDVWNQTTPDTACKWVRASAVRYALVAKSTQFESTINAAGQRVGDTVTAAAPTWQGSTDAPIDLTSDTDWKSFRYRTFETVVPARNLVWMEAKAGC